MASEAAGEQGRIAVVSLCALQEANPCALGYSSSESPSLRPLFRTRFDPALLPFAGLWGYRADSAVLT